MKLETSSTSMNTSALFTSTAANVEITLGWNEMPTFPEVVVESEMELGWGAMPAFGTAKSAPNYADEVAEFVSTTRRESSKVSVLASFWSSMSLRA